MMNKEIKNLIEYCKEYAEEYIEGTNEFNPFGAFIDKDGYVNPLEYENSKNENPLSGFVIEKLTKGCKEEFENGLIKAYAIVYEVNMQLENDAPNIDAIAIDIIHHAENNIPIFYIPYMINDKGIVSFDEMFAVKREIQL